MQSQHLQISYAEFERMPKKLGWKYEYFAGQAHTSPGHQVVSATIRTAPRSFNPPCELRSVENSDKSILFTSYLAAFFDTVEYCDYEPEKIRVSSREAIEGFFGGKWGQPHPVSQIAIRSQNVVGAALLTENSDGPILNMLYVVPDWQRQGVATALVSAAINELHGSGITNMKSRYRLANEISRTWHLKFGFEDDPDLMLAQHYRYHAEQEQLAALLEEREEGR